MIEIGRDSNPTFDQLHRDEEAFLNGDEAAKAIAGAALDAYFSGPQTDHKSRVRGATALNPNEVYETD